MTKKIITLLIVGTLSISFCSGCGRKISETIKYNDIETKAGNYEIYATIADQEYLKFLNNFDEEKYELIDISCKEYRWYITYKIKE